MTKAGSKNILKQWSYCAKTSTFHKILRRMAKMAPVPNTIRVNHKPLQNTHCENPIQKGLILWVFLCCSVYPALPFLLSENLQNIPDVLPDLTLESEKC